MKISLPSKEQITSKKFILPAMVSLVLVGGGTAYALTSRSPAPTTQPVQHSLTTAENVPVATSDTESTASQQVTSQPLADTPVSNEPVAPTPTPEENKTKVTQVISDYGTSKDMSSDVIYAQTSCFDRDIKGTIGYSDYNALFDSSQYPLLNEFLSGHMGFDGPVTCRVMRK
jgi:hypothetical protein